MHAVCSDASLAKEPSTAENESSGGLEVLEAWTALLQLLLCCLEGERRL